MRGSIAHVTCAQLAEGEDAQVLGPAPSALGMRPSWQLWDKPAVDWSAFDVTVLRSTWEYPGNGRGFFASAGSVPRLTNASGVVAWNNDESYLRDVAAAGIPVVPAEWSDPGEPVNLPADVGTAETALSHAVRNALMLPETTVHDETADGSTGLLVPERITSHRPDQDAAARIAGAVSRRL